MVWRYAASSDLRSKRGGAGLTAAGDRGPAVPATFSVDATWRLPGTDDDHSYHRELVAFARGDEDVLATYPTTHVCAFEAAGGRPLASARCTKSAIAISERLMLRADIAGVGRG